MYPPDETCWTLVRAAASGNAEARSAFARDYAAVVRGFLVLRWRGSFLAAEIDDATQDVFVDCFKTGGVLARADPTRGDFRGLLFGVARVVARRVEERAADRRRLLPEDSAWLDQVASDDVGQATLFDRSWAMMLLHRAKALHRQRAAADGQEGRRRIELLERRFGGDEAIRDIAVGWGVPAQAVHNAYRKARVEFYRCLREVVAFHSSATDTDAECRRLLVLLE